MDTNEREFGQWTAPFPMGAVDTKVVRRTNALLDYEYGHEFRRDEAMLLGKGPISFATTTRDALLERLQKNASVSFEIVEHDEAGQA